MITYKKGGQSIAIGTDPYHKRKGLYIGNDYAIQRIATFNNDDDAKAFDTILMQFLGLDDGKQLDINNV